MYSFCFVFDTGSLSLCPRDCYVDQDDLELTEILLPHPVLGALGLKLCPTMPDFFLDFFFSLFLEHLPPFNWTSCLNASPHQMNN